MIRYVSHHSHVSYVRIMFLRWVNAARSVYVNIWLAVLSPCRVATLCARTQKRRCVLIFLQVTREYVPLPNILTHFS